MAINYLKYIGGKELFYFKNLRAQAIENNIHQN